MDHNQISQYLQRHRAKWRTWIRNPLTASYIVECGKDKLEQQEAFTDCTSENTRKKFEWSSTTHITYRSWRNCQLTSNDNWNNQRRSKSCSTFSFQFTNDEVESRYASTWKLRTSRCRLSQTLEKNTTQSKWILSKMAQGVHSDITRTKIVQKQTKKLSDCSSEGWL